MERTRLLTFAVIGLFLLNLVTIGFVAVKFRGPFSEKQPRGPAGDPAERGPTERGPASRGPARIIIERLRLDEPQQRQYLDMVRQHHQQTIRLNEESIRLFQAYYNLLTATRPDSVKAHLLVEQIADNQRRIAGVNFSHFQQLKSLCRPDQQADFDGLVADLVRLFGRQQRPPGPGNGPPPEDHPEGPPPNFSPRP